jgi:hypothetical protein
VVRFLTTGEIVNSVNFPDTILDMADTEKSVSAFISTLYFLMFYKCIIHILKCEAKALYSLGLLFFKLEYEYI